MASSPAISLRILSRSEHGISRQSISQSCLKVLYGLIGAGYEAYIVGGGVRDLLLGLKPKDFDIATNATPEQVKAQFRNSRIIGRRFRIVHVHYGQDIIEVSTFRAASDDNATLVDDDTLSRSEAQLDAVRSTSGMILRDNVYGTIEEDVLRRDFTVNALYYTVKDFVVHDYVDGLADIDRRCLRMIGNAQQRYQEDPVRVLRAIRLAAKLNFAIAPETAAPIPHCSALLDAIPSARLFDEFLKLFLAGSSFPTYQLLVEYKVFEHLFPATAKALPGPSQLYSKMLEQALLNTDARLATGKSVTPVFILAVLLWPALQQALALQNQQLPIYQKLLLAGDKVLDQQVERIAIPKRFSYPIRELWELQHRFTDRRGKRPELLLSHKRFRAAFDFLLLREQCGEDVQGLGVWWQQFQDVTPEQRQSMLQELLPKSSSTNKGRRRKIKAPSPTTAS